MNRFIHASERPATAPPGGESNVSVQLTRAEKIRELTTSVGQRFIDAAQAPPGNESLNPTTSSRPRSKTRRLQKAVAVTTIAAAAVGVAGCNNQKKDAKLTGGRPDGTTTAPANKSVNPRFASPEEICDKASPVVAKLAHLSLTAARGGCVAEQDESGNPAISWSFKDTYNLSVISDDKDGAGFKKVYENQIAPVPGGVKTFVIGKYPAVSFLVDGLGSATARVGDYDVDADIRPSDMPGPGAQDELWNRTTLFAQNALPFMFAGADSVGAAQEQPQPNMPPSPGTDIPKVE